MSHFGRAVALTALCFASFASVSAHAQDADATAEARKLYGEAKKAMGDKKYREAALGFEAASKLRANAVSLYTAAQAWELAGEPARAADAYSLALATPKLNDSQTQRSQDRLADLEKQLGTLAITGTDGSLVQLDSHMELGLPARIHGAPGDHTLAIKRKDGTTESRSVTLEAGKQQAIDVDEKPEPQPEKPKLKKVKLAEPRKHPIETAPPSNTWKTVGFTSLGAGLAALGGTVLLGTSAKDAEKTYNATPTQQTYDHAKGLETKTNIALIAGGVLTAAGLGIIIWQTSKKPHVEQATEISLELGPSRVFAEGRF